MLNDTTELLKYGQNITEACFIIFSYSREKAAQSDETNTYKLRQYNAYKTQSSY